jgi:hypothetical protein
MGQSPSEANSHSAIQEISLLLWHAKVHCRVHMNSPVVPTMNQVHLVHTFPRYIPKVHPSIVHLLLGLPSAFFPSGFPTNIVNEYLILPIHATFPAHLIVLDSITLIYYYYYYYYLCVCVCVCPWWPPFPYKVVQQWLFQYLKNQFCQEGLCPVEFIVLHYIVYLRLLRVR